jgi:hypothetical protein
MQRKPANEVRVAKSVSSAEKIMRRPCPSRQKHGPSIEQDVTELPSALGWISSILIMEKRVGLKQHCAIELWGEMQKGERSRYRDSDVAIETRHGCYSISRATAILGGDKMAGFMVD